MTRSFETTCLFRFRSASNTGVKIETRATAAQMKVIGSITVTVYAEETWGKHEDGKLPESGKGNENTIRLEGVKKLSFEFCDVEQKACRGSINRF